MKIILAILIFSAIILFHELGHFLLAKKNKIVVTEFSLGMGPRLLSTVKNGTRYSLKLFPIGGSCAMMGDELKNVTLADTLKHPNWVMGQKITVDSATLVNKGLEVMEAKWLFDVDLDHIQVVVQPKSIIHSMVEFKDGAVMAQLGTPDMRLPIQYALYYPERRYLEGERLDFHKLKEITFEDPDMETFL